MFYVCVTVKDSVGTRYDVRVYQDFRKAVDAVQAASFGTTAALYVAHSRTHGAFVVRYKDGVQQ